MGQYLKTPGTGGLSPQGPAGVHPQPTSQYVSTSSGSGPPSASAGVNNQFYWDTSTTPATLYVNVNGTWTQVGTPLPTGPDGDVLANISGGVAQPTMQPLSAVLDHIFSSTEGAILYRDAAAWKALAPGIVGQLLQTGGPAAIPSWVTFAGGTHTWFGSGPPSTIHSDGDLYYDTSTSPFQLYVQYLGNWQPGSCCTTGAAAQEFLVPSVGVFDVGLNGNSIQAPGELVS